MAALSGSFLGFRGKTDPPPSPTVKQIALLRGGWYLEIQERLGTIAEGPQAPFGNASLYTAGACLPPSLLPPPLPFRGGREGSLSKPRTWVIPESSIACVGLVLQHSLPLQMSESDMSPQGCLHIPHWAKPSL